MSGSRFVWPNTFSVDPAGEPRSGANLYFYETGTNTPQTTYADPALSTPNPNPIPADPAGQFGNIFLLSSPSYRVVLTDANGVEVWTMDPVGPSVGSSGTVPVGGMISYGGTAAPSGWLLCYGQAVSRTTYAALFSAIGIAYGGGDGSTTFNVPDRRGRISVGKDNMGGVAANRVTTAGSGLNGLTLGAVGGDQLTQQHSHTVTDPGHTHGITDGGHAHTQTVGQNPGSGTTHLGTIANGSPISSGDSTQLHTADLIINSGTTGLTIANYSTGAAQNVQPSQIDNIIIYTGVA